MDSLSATTNGNETRSNISSKNDSLNFKSSERIAEVPVDKHEFFTEDVLNTEISTNAISFTESDSSKKSISVSNDVRRPEYYDESNVQNALSRMTVNDLDQFLNVYKMITSSDPNVDETINKASMDQLLSGELLGEEYNVNKLHVDNIEANVVDDEDVMDYSIKDYTFFDVYDHIESWKKRIQPTMNIIEDLAHEYKTIIQQTTTADNLEKPISDVQLEHTIKSDDLMTDSSRYLSNIDKYIETRENRQMISNNNFHQAQSGDTYNNANNSPLLHSTKFNDIQIPNENICPKKIFTPQKYATNRRTLLIPSDTYKETENENNNQDGLEVKTYFIEEDAQ